MTHPSYPGLVAGLAEPVGSGGPSLLSEIWEETTGRFLVRLPQPFEAGLWLTYAVRGAFGDVLYTVAPDEDGGVPPYIALMKPGHVMIDGRGVPVPVRITVEVMDDRATIDLTLFGVADRWRNQAFAAMIHAFGNGISVRENARLRRSWTIEDFWWTRSVGKTPPSGPARRSVLPLTPICYGAEEHDPARPVRFVQAALTRLKGMARWHQFDLDLDVPQLSVLDGRLTITPLGAKPIEHVPKKSRNHRGFTKKLEGERTVLDINGLTPAESEALEMAALIGGGGHTSYGFGAYHLI